MARTTQTTRKTTDNTAARVSKESPSKFAQTHKFAKCARCLVSMKKYGVGGTNGHTCPPCTQTIVRDDLKQREKIAVRQGVFVPENEDEPIKTVSMDEFNTAEKIAPVTCTMYHSAYAFKDTVPLYTCIMDDLALTKYPDNRRAMFVAGTLGVFHFAEGASLCGPCLFLGPNGTSLLPEEIAKLIK